MLHGWYQRCLMLHSVSSDWESECSSISYRCLLADPMGIKNHRSSLSFWKG